MSGGGAMIDHWITRLASGALPVTFSFGRRHYSNALHSAEGGLPARRHWGDRTSAAPYTLSRSQTGCG